MIPFVLIVCGTGVVLATVLLARRTRYRPAEPASPSDDPWAAYAPRSTEEIERDRPRLWPVAGALAGVVLVLGGLLAARTTPATTVRLDATPTPLAIEIGAAASPSPAETASPTPEASPTASPTPSAAATATPRARTTARPSSAPQPTPTPRPTPTPTPTPVKPGPTVGASTSCFTSGGSPTASINYSATARSGTRLTSLRLSLDGRQVASPGVSGRTQYSDSYSTSTSPGSHTFTLTASASDGGSTTRSFPVSCR